MSSKNLPPMDTIITRRKSAQLKRQLRNQDVSRQKISQITQLLRSPKSQIKPQKKKGKNATIEFYPDKARRRVEAKKVVLKPKHQMKVVAIGSKRKGVPQKGSNLSSPLNKRQKRDQSASETQPKKLMDRMQSELSIEELVREMDCKTLNDEDLLEILTCESPVWWEDPPDEGYCEDPIFTKKSLKSNLENDSEKTSSNSSETKELPAPEITDKLKIPQGKETDEKFMKKRSKLENLLGSIKTKLIPQKSDNSISTDNKLESNQLIPDEKNTKSINNDIKPKEINENINKASHKIKRLSESTEGDDPFTNFRDDDILRDLENIEIPVEPVNPNDSSNNDDCIVITNSKEVEQKIKNKMKIRNEYLNILRKKNVINDTNERANKIKQESDDKSTFSVTSIQKETLSSPISRSLSDETLDTISLVSHDIDSISDTNIKFIDDDSTSLKSNKGTDKTDDVTINVGHNKNLLLEDVASKSNIIQTQTNIKSNIHNCLTVYKIITKDEIDLNVIKKDDILKNNVLSFKELPKTEMNEKSKNSDGKFNLLYKKCKNTYERKIGTKKPKDTNELKEVNETDNKSRTNSKPIIVSNNSSVKYCFKCSSIFDTETCAYCISKTKIPNENNHEDKLACSCNNEIEQKNNVDKNLEEHAKK